MRAAELSILNAIELLQPGLQVSIIWGGQGDCRGDADEYHWACAEGVADIGKGSLGYDAAGNHFAIGAQRGVATGTSAYPIQRITPSGQVTTVTYLYNNRCREGDPCVIWDDYLYAGRPVLDTTNGRMILGVSVSNTPQGMKRGVIQIDGFPKLFDTLLTFLPEGGSLSLTTPAHPDGFHSADSLQLWAGDVRMLPDWSAAQPVACAAAMTPTTGQIITVEDIAAVPSVGHANYYVVATESLGQRRLGRQYRNGAYFARDPSMLPTCQ